MLLIKYVSGEIIVFEVDAEIWYLQTGPGIPCLYDHKLIRQNIPNIDIWFQARTGHRYSYRAVCDMAVSFLAGLNCAYSAQDIKYISASVCKETADIIFRTELIGDFRHVYWIEILDPLKLTQQADSIRDNMDRLVAELGDDLLYNHLCRLWKLCALFRPSEAAVFERLIGRMGRKPIDPEFIMDDELYKRLCDRVMGRLWEKDIPKHQVNSNIIRNADELQTRGL